MFLDLGITYGTDIDHVDYPHEPGRLYDCPACESECHCTDDATECVYSGKHRRAS